MTRWRAWAAVAVAVAAATAVTGCTSEAPGPRPTTSQSQTPAPPPPTTLAAYGSEGVAVARGPFCDRVSPTGIEHAVGDVPDSHDDHANGDRLRLPDGSRGIAHEYGCTWRAGGTTAQAWVFAPPVTRARAGELVEEALVGGCERTGTGDFGAPSVAVRCQSGDGVEASWRGLFGDAWLTCSLRIRGPAPDPTVRLDEWCVAVLDAARL